MNELIRVLVERVLSWPVAIFFLCLIFRSPLKSFLERIVLLKAPGVEVSAPSHANQQLVETKSLATSDQLALPLPIQQALPIPEDLLKQQEAIRNYGGNEPILQEQMENIRTHLHKLQFPLDSADTANVLIRHLAVTQLLARAEATYRLIFGSQIAVLQMLNQGGPQIEEPIRSVFEHAKGTSPKFYGDYSFESWSGFLVGQGAVLKEEGLYKITVYGSSFLEWMVAAKAPKKLY